MSNPTAIIESIAEIKEEPDWCEYHLAIVYHGKQAFISLPVRTGTDVAAPSTTLCRQEIAELADALRLLANSRAGIAWEN